MIMARMLVHASARQIWQTLGPGFSERVYHNAMEVCLRKACVPYETERIVPIMFMDHSLGNMRADLIVQGSLVVELKSVRSLKDEHRTQTSAYLRLLGLTDAVLINFPTHSDTVELEDFPSSD
jgi:GxxExxY protein